MAVSSTASVATGAGRQSLLAKSSVQMLPESSMSKSSEQVVGRACNAVGRSQMCKATCTAASTGKLQTLMTVDVRVCWIWKRASWTCNRQMQTKTADVILYLEAGHHGLHPVWQPRAVGQVLEAGRGQKLHLQWHVLPLLQVQHLHQQTHLQVHQHSQCRSHINISGHAASMKCCVYMCMHVGSAHVGCGEDAEH